MVFESPLYGGIARRDAHGAVDLPGECFVGLIPDGGDFSKASYAHNERFWVDFRFLGEVGGDGGPAVCDNDARFGGDGMFGVLNDDAIGGGTR